ncbi:zinc ribbon domain-containing protein [Candidatus Pacearchaeota archaeon]|nr:zinc ribbon domain-containing protein [Candidatus Pacearchaeota archaeon]
MTYCSNCGDKLSLSAKYCNKCGKKVDYLDLPIRNYPRIKEETIPVNSHKNHINPIEINNIIKPVSIGFFRIIIWMIVLLILFFIFMGIISNIETNGGSLKLNSDRTDNWWGTTHKTTSIGSGGLTTEEHSCPFWDRDC